MSAAISTLRGGTYDDLWLWAEGDQIEIVAAARGTDRVVITPAQARLFAARLLAIAGEPARAPGGFGASPTLGS